MRILITGSRGLVGRALASEYRDEDVTALAHRELDITDGAAVDRVVNELRPDVIFNCAVIGVDECEARPDVARSVNVAGPTNLARAARTNGASMVHFSTNYVFDGRREGEPYTIDDAPNAVNVYGRTKAEGERAVVEECERAFIVRTSWVFGRGKESFLATAPERLRRGERAKAINDIRASTTYVADLVRRVREIVKIDRPATYHVVNSGVCSYEEFAREAARLVGASEELIDVISESTLDRAPRPRYTPMRCLVSERLGLPLLRPWTAALAAYVGAAKS